MQEERPLAAGEAVHAHVGHIVIADDHVKDYVIEQAVHIQPVGYVLQVGRVVEIMAFYKVHQLYPVLIAAVQHVAVQRARALQNIAGADGGGIGYACPLSQRILVGLFAQIVVPKIFAVQIHHNRLRRLVVQPQPFADFTQHRIAHAAGAVIGIGGAQQKGGILRVGTVVKEGVIKGIRAEGLAGEQPQGFLPERAGGMRGDAEGGHLAELPLPRSVKVFDLDGVFPVLFIVGGYCPSP